MGCFFFKFWKLVNEKKIKLIEIKNGMFLFQTLQNLLAKKKLYQQKYFCVQNYKCPTHKFVPHRNWKFPLGYGPPSGPTQNRFFRNKFCPTWFRVGVRTLEVHQGKRQSPIVCRQVKKDREGVGHTCLVRHPITVNQPGTSVRAPHDGKPTRHPGRGTPVRSGERTKRPGPGTL